MRFDEGQSKKCFRFDNASFGPSNYRVNLINERLIMKGDRTSGINIYKNLGRKE